jgi:hypothetical protein
MRRRVVACVIVIGLALGIGWYVKAQDASNGLPTFQAGQILTADDLNAIVNQVDENTTSLTGPPLRFVTTLSREQEVPTPAGGTLTGGTATLQFNAGFTQVDVTLTLTGDSPNANRAHFHCNLAGLTGTIAFGLVDPGPCDATQLAAGNLMCTLTNDDFTGNDCVPNIGRPVSNIAALYFAALDGEIYLNVHTPDNPPGEVRGQLVGPLP